MVQMDPQPLLQEVTARKRAPEVRPVSSLMQLFTLLVRKELLLKLRRPLITLFEIIFPAGLCAILIAGSRASQTNYYNATGFAPANFSAAVGSLGPQVLGPVLLSGEAQSTGANAGGLPSIPVPGAVPPLGVFLLYANVFSLCSPGQVRRSDPLTPSPRRPAPTPLHTRLRCSWRRPTAPSSPWRPTRRRPVRWPRRCSRTPTCTASYCAPTPTTLHLAPPRPPPPSARPTACRWADEQAPQYKNQTFDALRQCAAYLALPLHLHHPYHLRLPLLLLHEHLHPLDLCHHPDKVLLQAVHHAREQGAVREAT